MPKIAKYKKAYLVIRIIEFLAETPVILEMSGYLTLPFSEKASLSLAMNLSFLVLFIMIV